jgi:hypothetical protein
MRALDYRRLPESSGRQISELSGAMFMIKELGA